MGSLVLPAQSSVSACVWMSSNSSPWVLVRYAPTMKNSDVQLKHSTGAIDLPSGRNGGGGVFSLFIFKSLAAVCKNKIIKHNNYHEHSLFYHVLFQFSPPQMSHHTPPCFDR